MFGVRGLGFGVQGLGVSGSLLTLVLVTFTRHDP